MSTAKAIQIKAHGGPEVMEYVDMDLSPPGPGEVRLRHTAIGLNFIDVYMRTGLYPAKLPAILGREAAGVVEAVGPGVNTLKSGDRVVYSGLGAAYSTERNASVSSLVQIPDDVTDEQAAAIFLKGLTAWMLLSEVRPLQADEQILVWAAAGGVASVLIPWAKAIGGRVMGVVSSDEKAAVATELGCEEVVLASDDVAARAREWSCGRGVAVAYDSVGKTSAEASLNALRPRGWFVSYGNASGPVDPIAPLRLSQGGSLIMTRPGLHHFAHERSDLERGSAALWKFLQESSLKMRIGQRFGLADAAEAHRALESRQTTGATILQP